MSQAVPTPELAATLAREVAGVEPTKVTRFTTGSQHYVYEARFAVRAPVVVRIGSAVAQREMAGALHLSGLLRPAGVPLPAVLAHDVEAELPWLMLERLNGTDLGAVFGVLTASQLDRIAAGVAAAQAAVARTRSEGGYGYAVRPEEAPLGTWQAVLQANLDRSRRRMTASGLFDIGMIDVIETVVVARRDALSGVAATPFLHDTTTKNVIIDENGRLSGIVDVDDLCFGDARYPAALTFAVLLAYGYATDYVTAWLRHAEQRDDTMFRLYVAIFLLDLMAEHGQVFNGNEKPSRPEARAVLIEAFSDTLRMIGA